MYLYIYIYFFQFPFFLNFIPEEFCSLTDLEKLSTFSQRFPLPSMYRIHVWKVLLGKNHMRSGVHPVTLFSCADLTRWVETKNTGENHLAIVLH